MILAIPYLGHAYHHFVGYLIDRLFWMLDDSPFGFLNQDINHDISTLFCIPGLYI